MFWVKTCSAQTNYSPLQPSTQSSVAHFLTTSIRVVALCVSVAVEDSIFHTFHNKSCKDLLEQDTKNLPVLFYRLPFALWIQQKVLYQYEYYFPPQIHTHQGWKVCVLYFVFVFPMMWLFCSAYIYAGKLSYSA